MCNFEWLCSIKRVWISQRGINRNPYIEEEQTTQCPKEKVQKDKQRSTKNTHKAKDRVTRTLLKTGKTMEKLAILIMIKRKKNKKKPVTKSNRKIVERDATLIPPTHTYTWQ